MPPAVENTADLVTDHDAAHGPFGRPLFDDPSARALSRVGVVDVGSNSVRMVVFDGAARSPAYFDGGGHGVFLRVFCQASLGTSFAPAVPRPDSEGFSMKKR